MNRFAAVLAAALVFVCACGGPDDSRTDSRQAAHEPVAELSVKAYGAKGDGATDDRPAIQAALDAADSRDVGVHFPAGTYNLRSATLTGDRILRTYADQHLRGDGQKLSALIVGSSFGEYTTVIGAASDSTFTGNWSMRDLRIDQNATRGNALNVARLGAYPRMAVRLGSYEVGSSVTIARCAFINSDSVNVLYLFGDVLRVTANHFLAIGGRLGTATHDHSTSYTSTTTANGLQEISGNFFEGVRGSGGARTGIETHGGQQTVNANTVTDYLRGANLTGIADVPTERITSTENTVTRGLVGMQVWAAYHGSLTSGTVLSDVVVKRNTITLDRDAWSLPGIVAPASGVLINTSNTALIDGISIESNTISYLPSTTGRPATDQNSAAIYCYVSDKSAELRELRIVGNAIIHPLSTGISPTCQSDGARAERNTVVE